MSSDPSFSLANRTRGVLPRIPFMRLKDRVLGSRYELSLAFVAPREARRITKRVKGKDKASNVLSFPLSKHSGEILICPATARAEAPEFGRTYSEHLARLFIHGLFHLKGLKHGATMERSEREVAKAFRV